MSITPPRVLVLAPQPFYEDRGTPIAVRHLLEALCELEYHVDLLTYPVGASIDLSNLHIRRVGTTFRFKSLGVLFPAACGDVKNIFLVDTPSACGGVVHCHAFVGLVAAIYQQAIAEHRKILDLRKKMA
jgi:hypothetical protein